MLKYPVCSLSRKGVNYQMILSRFNLCIKVDNDRSHSLRQKTCYIPNETLITRQIKCIGDHSPIIEIITHFETPFTHVI